MKKNKQSSAAYKIKKGFITQKIGNKINIFDGEESLLYTLNETASFIFEKLKQELEEEKIIELLVKRYSIIKERAEEHVGEFIKELKKRGVIK